MYIYQILNKTDNKSYIGSTQNIVKRKTVHINSLRKNNHENQFLQNAWNKYGEDNFEFNILKHFDNISRNELYEIENTIIQEMNTVNENYGYNIANPANKPPIVKSPESLLKRSNSLKGKKRPEWVKEKISLSKMGDKNPMYGKPQSEETRKKRSESLKGRPSPMKGKKQSQKFLDAHIGKTPWNKGLKMSDYKKNET